MNLTTPEWIQKWLVSHDGGWFFPMSLDSTHPIVLEKWNCLDCGLPFAETDVALIMPYTEELGTKWTATHRKCVMGRLGLVDKV